MTSTFSMVYVETPDGQSIEGRVIRGEMADSALDLDTPFLVETDDGERIYVSAPWNCTIDIVKE